LDTSSVVWCTVLAVSELFERVEIALREKVLPLVAADAGELYLVAVSEADVHVHLAGTCSGCPGAHLTEQYLIAPVVSGVVAKSTLLVTTGYKPPAGAKKL
jgi:Fe-S cluster biogenesis protein NfuA